MSRSASAAPGPDVARLAVALIAAVVVVTVGGAIIALVGLGQFSGDIDPARVPGWFWHYRHDPEVRRWLAVGAASSSLLVVLAATGAALSRRRPLHGAARWATRSEERAAGLRAEAGVLLGHASDGGLLVSDGPSM